jgi:protease I
MECNGEPMGKKILMIIPPEKFRDEELFVPKGHFEEKGIEIVLASTKTGECSGMMGRAATAEIALADVDVKRYDAIVFVGGSGTPLIRKEKKALEIVRDAATDGKVLGAICWAPTILAKAGVLEGKRATVWNGEDAEFGMKTSEYLESRGATYSSEGFVVDGKIVTADGPAHAKEFARAIEGLLE